MTEEQRDWDVTSEILENPGSKPPTGAEYLESLRDGREVWFQGEKVADVTSHIAFRNSGRMIARLYDALHDTERNKNLIVATDTGSNGYTHGFFRAPYTVEDLQRGADACETWARMTYGWMGRTPDFKAAFLTTLGSNEEYYSPYQENAKRWYRKAQEQVTFFNHAIVNPPIDRNRPMEEVRDAYMHVEEETDAGLIVSGAKVVATGSVHSQMNFISNAGPLPVRDKAFSGTFAVPMNARGVKLICRPSYEYNAAVSGSPFDNPLSSRLDENDAILVFDKVLVPWEDVFCYDDIEKANSFFIGSGFALRGRLQGCVRLAVKLDFICGLFLKGLEMTGAKDFYGVQVRIGEMITYRHLFWTLARAMVKGAERWPDGSVVPNAEAGEVFRVMLGVLYPRVREIFQQDLASALIYTNSHSSDFGSDELAGYLDKYARGSNGATGDERMKVIKLIWDAMGSEFGSRHELYERNYGGSHEMVKMLSYKGAQATGQLDGFMSMVDECMSEYDVNGWTAPDLIDPR
ncbi:4-hydroxyphenylacetate 3-hydroxylase N-terminal domain-containing protein [Spirillospora sp. NPDC047418]|jgi:4-hydroxyphenylacetate 3-monooxygenase